MVCCVTPLTMIDATVMSVDQNNIWRNLIIWFSCVSPSEYKNIMLIFHSWNIFHYNTWQEHFSCQVNGLRGLYLMIVCVLCYLTWHDYPFMVEVESHYNTHRIVVPGGTSGTVASCTNIHRTVVLKHRHLSGHRSDWPTQPDRATNKSATSSTLFTDCPLSAKLLVPLLTGVCVSFLKGDIVPTNIWVNECLLSSLVALKILSVSLDCPLQESFFWSPTLTGEIRSSVKLSIMYRLNCVNQMSFQCTTLVQCQ